MLAGPESGRTGIRHSSLTLHFQQPTDSRFIVPVECVDDSAGSTYAFFDRMAEQFSMRMWRLRLKSEWKRLGKEMPNRLSVKMHRANSRP